MKYLTIVRHAKSSWGQPGLADHDRPLNERGQRAAPAVATFLHRTYFGGNGAPPLLPLPERLVTSTALRALSTAQIMRETFAMPVESLKLESRLYLAEATWDYESARRDEARKALEAILAAAPSAEAPVEDRRTQETARAVLAALGRP